MKLNNFDSKYNLGLNNIPAYLLKYCTTVLVEPPQGYLNKSKRDCTSVKNYRASIL